MIEMNFEEFRFAVKFLMIVVLRSILSVYAVVEKQCEAMIGV